MPTDRQTAAGSGVIDCWRRLAVNPRASLLSRSYLAPLRSLSLLSLRSWRWIVTSVETHAYLLEAIDLGWASSSLSACRRSGRAENLHSKCLICLHDPTVVAQWAHARYSWTERTAADPSPTAAATRLIEPDRTSPTANNPGELVSNGSGRRPSASHRSSRRASSRERSVSTKPWSSSAAHPDNQLAAGSAPMKEKRAAQGNTASTPSVLMRTDVRVWSAARAEIVLLARTRMCGSASMRSTR